MMNLKEVPAYTFQDFWSMKPRYTLVFYRIISYLIAPLCILIFYHNFHYGCYSENLRIRFLLAFLL